VATSAARTDSPVPARETYPAPESITSPTIAESPPTTGPKSIPAKGVTKLLAVRKFPWPRTNREMGTAPRTAYRAAKTDAAATREVLRFSLSNNGG